MNRHHSRTIRSSVAAAMVTATLLAAGCGSSDDGHDHAAKPMDSGGPTAALTTPPPPPLPEQFSSVDQNDPEAVMVAAAQTLFSYTPATDPTQAAGADRAAPLLDERFYAENKAAFSVLAPITGAQWDRWTSANATVTARAALTGDNHPPDAPARISRVVAVTQTATTPAGAVLDESTVAVYMSATRLGVWRVSALTVR
ncbi:MULTISPECIES: hypothetical protein [unclassified Rhodococcus (in: high G+C Gram-positive bacteria)]|uniref:hypothetical protein n=1 Tax=unclassified Rhodococcus (in: high G+C Gram-positive bacteria) TaxID=192944 RepID=UPI00163B13CA|nr:MULTISPECIES: hypothetical protein [unclassified Rhodococcus (in: high G+C Gram-positive bacteria)]MBC2644306.1 hypothetical protein [Rhodococcus sp. 3A]MBC2898001.1 hypothetical protein [Rhodococcus sp. 4CII]